MGYFSIFWALFIVGLTWLVYKIVQPFVRGKKNRIIWLVAIISLCVYSAIGIAYSTISKEYIFTYVIYAFVMGVTFAIFSSIQFSTNNGRIYARLRDRTEEWSKDSRDPFWDSDFAKKAFIALFILYFILRFGSLIYPVNKLSEIGLVYDSVNNLKNISGENASILNSIAAYVKPFAYIGLFYRFNKVRYVAVFLGIDLLITLMYSGYLSRSFIICALFIALMLYFNNDISDDYISLSKKRRRIVTTLGLLGPIVIYMMIYLMTIRISSNQEWTVMSFFSSEIDYPKHYDYIFSAAGTFMEGKDMIYHILDSFIPIVPTPSYTANLNVLFSERVTGIDMDLSWFSVLLPSQLGEAVLIFGKNLFWIHAILIGIMMSGITLIIGDNKKMVILYYYFLTCIMKTARGGYVELSSTVVFNIVIIWIVLYILRILQSCFRAKGR